MARLFRIESICPVERDPGVCADGNLNMSQKCALATERANHVLGCNTFSIAQLVKGGDCSTPYCVQFWASQYKEDIKLFHYVQRRASGDEKVGERS